MRSVPREQAEESLSTIRLLVSGWRQNDECFAYARSDGAVLEVAWQDERVHLVLSDACGAGFRSSVDCDAGLASVIDELVAEQDRMCASRAGASVRALTRAGARLVSMAVVT